MIPDIRDLIETELATIADPVRKHALKSVLVPFQRLTSWRFGSTANTLT
jgi:hypothetical protein